MSGTAKSRLIKYSVAGAVSAAMVVLYLWLRDFGSLELVDKYRVLCDSFTVPGVMLVMAGCLIWVTNQGTLDGVTYVVSYAAKMLIPGRKDRQERYGDYVARKREKRVSGYGFLFVVGGVCMALSLVFMVLFYSLYQK